MLFIFPRLDRPTVVGSEGRPRSVSLGIAALTVLVLSVLAGYFLENTRLVATVGVLTGSLVAGLALLERDRFGSLVVGTVLAVPLSTALVWWLGRSAFGSASGYVSAGMGIALLGIGLTWIDLDSKDDVEAIIDRIAVAYGGSALGGFVPLVLYGVFLLVLDMATPGDSGFASPYALPLSVALLSGAVYFAANSLPVVQLSPRRRRRAVAERVARVRRLAGIGAGLSIAVAVAVPFVGTTSSVARVLQALSVPPLVWSLLIVCGVLLGTTGIAGLARRVTRDRNATAQRRVAAMVAGAIVGTVLLALPLPSSMLAMAILLLLVGPILFIVAAVLLGIVMGMGIVPERFGGLSLASAGLGIMTVGAGLYGMPAPFVFAAGAGTVIVWDVSTYGAGVTAELGHLPETRRLELVHAVVALFVGSVAVVTAMGLYALRTTADVGATVTTAMAVALIGAIVALLPLRG